MPALNHFDVNEFLTAYWQKAPQMISQAIADFTSPVSPDELAGLALETDIESRLVSFDRESHTWSLEHGPFDVSRFGRLPEQDWTLLVQAVDLWIPSVGALRDYFDFIPPWRIDDIMVSFAAPGGGVGPHFDHYDVFLLQAQGQREWQLGKPLGSDARSRTDTDLNLLAEFETKETLIAGPGDILYLPPRVPHWGTAIDDCLTLSVGFRSPTRAEMLGDLATELLARDDSVHYLDPPMVPAMADEHIDPKFIGQVQVMLNQLASETDLLTDWFARYMTGPKYPDLDIGEVRRANTTTGRYQNGERIE